MNNKAAYPFAEPSTIHDGYCRRLWNDDIAVLTKPFEMAVIPLVTFIICSLFILFLIFTLRTYLRRQKDSPSPSRRIYLIFVWVLAVVNILRSITDIWLDNVERSKTDLKLKVVVWAVEATSNSIVFAIEASVVVFVLHAHMQVWSELLRKVSIITGLLFGAYSIAQIPMIYLNRDRMEHFGYYSVYNFWIAINSAWVLVYTALLIFKAIGSEAIRMPKRAIFTVYMVCMLLLHAVFVANCVGIFYFGVEQLYCVSSVAGVMHYVLMGPMLFYAFLWDFVFPPHKESPFSELYNNGGFADDQYFSTNSSIGDLSAQSQWLLNSPNRTAWPHD